MKKKLILGVLVGLISFVVIYFINAPLFPHAQPRPKLAYACGANYTECESGASNYCTDNAGAKAGDWTHVTQNSSCNWGCSVIGYYSCNAEYWGPCGGSYIGGKSPGLCWSGMSGSQPSVSASQILYGPAQSKVGDSTACGGQAAQKGIKSDAALYCVCGVPGAAACPTPTTALTPTDTPTPTPNNVTPTPTSPPGTTGNLTLQVQGIDNTTTPLHQIRQVVLYFYPSTDTSFQHSPYVAKGNITYNPSNGYFSNASFPLTGLVAGKYLVLARTLQGSLVAQIGTGDGTGPITIVNTGGANMLVDTQDTSDTNADTAVPVLLMGDFITDCSSSSCDFNYVHTLDWSVIVDCFGDKKTSATCTAHGTFPNTQDTVTDVNDDGQVDGIDYTILMKNYGAFGIGQQTMNRGNPPQ